MQPIETHADLIVRLCEGSPTISLSKLRTVLAEHCIRTSKNNPLRLFKRHAITRKTYDRRGE